MDIHKFGKVPLFTTRLHKNDIWQTCGVSLAGKITVMIYLTPERRLCFLLDQASSLQDSELSEEALLEEALCKSLFPRRQHGQPACGPATSTQPLYSDPYQRSGRTNRACQLSGPLQAQTFARMPSRMQVYLYLSLTIIIYLSIIWLAGWLAG